MNLRPLTRDVVAFGFEVDLSVNTGITFVVPENVDYVSIQRTMVGGIPWPTGTVPVIEMKQSMDGVSFQSFATAITYNTAGVGAAFAVIPGSYLRASVTTKASSAAYCIITANGGKS